MILFDVDDGSQPPFLNTRWLETPVKPDLQARFELLRRTDDGELIDVTMKQSHSEAYQQQVDDESDTSSDRSTVNTQSTNSSLPGTPTCLDLEKQVMDTLVPEKQAVIKVQMSNTLLPCRLFDPTLLTILMSRLRQSLEKMYETQLGGLPSELIDSFYHLEIEHQLDRHPSTNCIWNVDHHEQRVEVFQACDVKMVYRQKCVCKSEAEVEEEDIDMKERSAGDGAVLFDGQHVVVMDDDPSSEKSDSIHSQDPYCPTNIPAEEKKETNAKLADESFRNIMDLVGVQEAKDHISKLRALVKMSSQRGIEIKGGRYGTVFLGNPGTGKTIVARQYAKYLTTSGIASGNVFIETTGTWISRGMDRGKLFIDTISKSGGVLFIDEAHQMNDYIVLDFILDEVERRERKVILVLAGSEKGMQELLSTGNARTLFQYVIQFKDFSDEELMQLLSAGIKKKFNQKMKVEGGTDGLYMRILARRLGRSRGDDAFANARAVENMLNRIYQNQSTRLTKESSEIKAEVKGTNFSEDPEEKDVKGAGVKESAVTKVSPEYLLTKEDIIGYCPDEAVLASNAWKKLQKLSGLKSVKDAILNIFELCKTNYYRELQEKPLLQLQLNRLFLGQPGTGKTVVAKLYGQILADIGVLSKGELIVKNSTDLIGRSTGSSEDITKSALKSARGSVLVIDEAYMLYNGGSDGTGNESDSFRQGILDTLVAEISSAPGEDRCVLLLGYTDQMQEMIRNGNPGLARRFPLQDAFIFEDFTSVELENILRMKLEGAALEATEEAIKVAIKMLDKARSRVNFGNGGEVENIINIAKSNYQKRISTLPNRNESWIFEPQDFDPDYNRGESATTKLKEMFAGVIGCEAIIGRLERYQRTCQIAKLRNINPRTFIPTNFIFKGPPGTGKTTTARKISEIYYDMGFLADATVIECSASDLVGKYIGHSGPKTIKILEKALGKCLFIDEAYRLAEKSGAEVVAELVDCLTKTKFQGKMIVILAGYDDEMDCLLSSNMGLASRFPEEFIFEPMRPKHCLEVLRTKLLATKITLPVVDEPTSSEYRNLIRLLYALADTPSWGNAREIETLAKTLCVTVLFEVMDPDKKLVCTAAMVKCALETLLKERQARPAGRGPNGKVPAAHKHMYI